MALGSDELIADFLTDEEQDWLVSYLDSKEWNGDGVSPNPELRRRTMQFGATFLFKTRTISERKPIPSELSWLLAKVERYGSFNHLVCNEYKPGQGIMPHTDGELFGPVIVVLSLLSSCLITFSNDSECFQVELKPKSLLIMKGDIRFKFKHSISKDEIEYIGKRPIHRARRISITFRQII